MLDNTDTTNNFTDLVKDKIFNQTRTKLLYLKLEIANFNYLILLSDIIEIKKTNLIAPIMLKSANEKKIYGTFYFQNEIIPVYKLAIKRAGNDISIFIKDCKNDKLKVNVNDYQDLLLVENISYYGFIIDGITKSEIIDINFAKSINAIENYDIIDINQLILNIKD